MSYDDDDTTLFFNIYHSMLMKITNSVIVMVCNDVYNFLNTANADLIHRKKKQKSNYLNLFELPLFLP